MKKFVLAGLLPVFAFQLNAQSGISGKVIDAASEEPMSRAQVKLDNTYLILFTDGKGEFQFTNVSAGEHILEVSSDRFVTQKITLDGSNNSNLVIRLEPIPILLENAVISGLDAALYIPVVQDKITKAQLEAKNLGKDLPYLLESSPSLVSYSDAGAGIGYTGFRIRGTDITRTNVTINGIPVNEPESHGVFWVDIPDLASSSSGISIQRGVGSSTNGSGAFGATVNITTNDLNTEAFGRISSNVGMFNTFRNTLEVNSGLIGKHFIVNARASKITSDGYIDRGWSDLKSFFVSGGYFGKNTVIKFNMFSGKEATYQAWNGLLQDSLATNRTYNQSGTDYGSKTDGPYSNETDNYQQDYYQLFITQYFGKYWNLNIAPHYRRGKGYYEQYKTEGNVYLPDYGIEPPVLNGDTVFQSDIIRRLWLDNHYFGAIYNVNYTRNTWHVTLGGGTDYYLGKGYGNVVWARFAGNSEFNHRYYYHDANKLDMNVYGKADWVPVQGLHIFADLQYRYVNYNIYGFEENPNLVVEQQFHFFNPKFGLSYTLKSRNRFYVYFGIANKEPARVDYETAPSQRPTFETLRDLEFGYTRTGKIYTFTANGFFMDYTNQLVQTGQINNVGAYTRTNAASSFRLGLELEGAVTVLKKLTFNANLTLSMNKIRNFTEFIDNYDNGLQDSIAHGTTDISFSPPIVAFLGVQYKPVAGLSLAMNFKYVDQQFMDNTSNTNRILKRYATGDFIANYSFWIKDVVNLGFNLGVYNFFNTLYEPNGYTFSYIYGGQSYTENYYYPQAGIHVMGGLQLKFMKRNS